MDEVKQTTEQESKEAPKQKARRDDIEDEDDLDTFLKYRKELEQKGLLIGNQYQLP